MIISTKPLVAAMESAEKRLEELEFRSRLQSPAAPIDLTHEVGALYNLFLRLAASLLELQEAHNKDYGG